MHSIHRAGTFLQIYKWRSLTRDRLKTGTGLEEGRAKATCYVYPVTSLTSGCELISMSAESRHSPGVLHPMLSCAEARDGRRRRAAEARRRAHLGGEGILISEAQRTKD